MTLARTAVALALAASAAALTPSRGGAQIVPVRTDTTHLLPGQRPVQAVPPRQFPVSRDTPPADTSRRDTSRAGAGGARDTSHSRVPKAPSRQLQSPDSVTSELMRRAQTQGYRATRYDADSVTLHAREKIIDLSGHALLDREGTQLEADSVRYQQNSCQLFAVGGPKLFDKQGNVIGEGMHYDACNHTGIIDSAATTFNEGGANWILGGDIAIDNTMHREYVHGAIITSCDQPDPHYHFAAREVKYVSKRLMVSRPAVLYVADIPVLWLPFIFQDMRHGRRSGILPPQIGINDIIRSGHNYHRHIANIGYYWALSDYADAQVSMDWYAQRYIDWNGRFRYKVLNRFLSGGLDYQQINELGSVDNGVTTPGGSVSRHITWDHVQQFNLATSLTAHLDYASSARVISRNAVDPVLAVAQIDSRLNFTRKYAWGTLAMGGSRSQSLDKPLVSTTFPTISFTPNPLAIGNNVVWSPGFSLTNSLQSHVFQGQLAAVAPGVLDTVLNNNRTTNISLSSPVRVGRWSLPFSVTIADQWSDVSSVDTIRNAQDTTQFTLRTFGESYSTGIDWNTGIALPTLFQGTWNLSPSVSIGNRTSGPYLVRNQFTNGQYVSQGKRLSYSLSTSPTFFGRFPGIGPVTAIRHAISPSLSWTYAPSTTIPLAYAQANNHGATPRIRTSPTTQAFSIGLSQNFEGKLRPPPRPPGDTAAPNPDQPEQARKIRLLSVQTTGFSFDVQQAKQPFRTAWQTDQLSNTFSSDLLRGFSISMAHDLWIGPAGWTASRFSPTLTSVAAGFQVGAGTIRALGGLLGLHTTPPRADSLRDTTRADTARQTGDRYNAAFQRGPNATRYSAIDRLTPGIGASGGSFSSNVSFSLQSPRPDSLVRAQLTDTAGRVTQQALYVAGHRTPAEMLSGSLTFRPTAHWNLSWQTSYNVTTGQFSDHVVRLDRDLHDWRATFTFVKSPNGNFLFSFFIQLIDQPEIKFDYDQRNIR